MSEEIEVIDPEVELLRLNKESGYNYRERRHQDWLENYTLYRDKVILNRLTQRQSVNIPLMKQTVRTLLKDVDDMPVLFFENLDNDKQAEIFQNEYWKWIVDYNNMELQDIIDKRQVFLFGRSFDQWQIVDGKIKMTVQDPQDLVVSRYADPFDLHSSRFLIHTHIFKPLSVLLDDPDYDQEALKKLSIFHETNEGLKRASDNLQMLTEKNEKMSNLGVDDVDQPVLGETYVEINLNFVYDKRDGSNEEELFLKVTADDYVMLLNKPLEDVIGKTVDGFWKNHFPYNSWADDLERQDFWSDGIADMIRTPNKILNSFFSQLVENRTLRNFGMNYFNSAIEGFNPNTFNPVPWGWYGIPVPSGGRISDVVQKIDIPDLSESLDEMGFIISMIEKASGATATQQGVQVGKQVTLGEVQLALGEAKERIKGMSKFYTPAWKQRGQLFLKLIEAGGDKLDAVTVYKKGKNTNNVYSREIAVSDWRTESGYSTKIWSQDEKDTIDTDMLQKLNLAVSILPGNPKLMSVVQRKTLEFANLSPDEINEVMMFEEQKQDAIMNQINQTGVTPQLGAGIQLPAQVQQTPNQTI